MEIRWGGVDERKGVTSCREVVASCREDLTLCANPEAEEVGRTGDHPGFGLGPWDGAPRPPLQCRILRPSRVRLSRAECHPATSVCGPACLRASSKYRQEWFFEEYESGGVSELENSVGEDLPFEEGEDQGGGIEFAPVPRR